MTITKKSFFAWLAGATLLTLLLIACQKNQSGYASGSTISSVPAALTVFLTDHETLVFDKVMIDIRKVEIKLEDVGADSLGGWFELTIRPGIYDILRFKNGLDTLFATGTIPANHRMQKIRLTLGDNNSVEKSGQSILLKISDQNNVVEAKLDDSIVELVSADQFHFWIDFDAGNSIKRDNSGSGNNNGYELRSHIRIFSKNKSGRIEGKVLPAEAQPMVMAIQGSDTATAKPEREGEFKIVGLNAGTYQLYIAATAGNYKDSIISNVVVRNGEDTHTGTIVLHQ